MENIEPNQNYIKELENYMVSIDKRIDYSVERFDILIISLSSSGLAFSIGFVKDIIENLNKGNPIEINFFLLETTWLLFACSLVFNLISQVTGYYANKQDLIITRKIIKNEKKKGSKEVSLPPDESLLKLLSSATMFLNGGSLLLLIAGIITLILFMFKHI
ncbi:MAG TPA: hypothetical protein VK205_14445 [Prolixibacteraceae bacterium]|nr:hypothetical protein [Prolixibacteraceae bacterium]